MKRLLNAAFIYMLVGVASGLFYREFTKMNGFAEGQFTRLGLAHTHLLTLGFIVLLIVLALGRCSASRAARSSSPGSSGSTTPAWCSPRRC